MSTEKAMAWCSAISEAKRQGCRFETFGHGFIAFGRTVEESQRKHDRLMRTRGVL